MSNPPASSPDSDTRLDAIRALRDAESTLRRIVATSPLAIIDLDGDDRVLSWNPAAERIFGWRADEVIGRRLPIASVEEQRTFVSRFDPHLRGVVTDGAEVVRFRKDGSPVDVAIWTAPQRDERGRVTSSLGIIADISGRTRTEAALRASEENYRRLVDHAPAPILVCTVDGEYVFANDAALKLLRATGRDDIVGRSAFDIVLPKHHDHLHARMRRILAGDVVLPIIEVAMRRCDGTVVAAESAATLCEYHGRPAVQIILYDLTERRQAQQQLLASQQKYRELVDSLDGIVWEVDARTFEFRFVSPQAERILGYPVAQWHQSGFWLNHLHPDDRDRSVNFCVRATREKRDHDFEYRMKAVDGRWVWLHDHVTVIVENGAPALLRGVMIDITARKQLEEQLLQSQKLEAIGRLAGGVAHDFNNILTAILGNVELALALSPQPTQICEHLNATRELAERAADLTHRLLTFARRQVLDTRSVDLRRVLRGARGLLERLLPENITLSAAEPFDLWPVTADPSQLEQVIVNLAVNARDAMQGGGKLSIELSNLRIGADDAARPSELPPGDYVRVTVQDCGTGIDPTIRAHLFEPFFTTKGPGHGTGLGLASAHGFITQLGGRIEVESSPGTGTAFHVLLPRSTEPPAPEHAPRAAAELGGNETVLLVEDEPLVRDVAVAALAAGGYTVLAASSAADALRLARSHTAQIDLLLTDVVMPQVSGPRLSEQIRALRPDLRVLFTSGYAASAAFRDSGVDSRTAPFLPKPYTPRTLTAKVREVLGT